MDRPPPSPPPSRDEGNSQPLVEDTKQEIVIMDNKEDVKPNEEAKAAMAGDFFHLESNNAKIDLKTEQDFLDSKVNVKILDENFTIKSDVITAGSDRGAASCAALAAPSEKNLDSLSCSNEDCTILQEGGAVANVETGVNKEIIPSYNCGSAIPPVNETIIGDSPLPEASKNKAKKPRYKKRKKPPPFIGPQRPIQYEDLEDIMNGVYDLHFDILDTDEETPVLSSSNESCDSSDPEGWLVESGDEASAFVAGQKVSSNVSKSVEFVKTALEETIAAKDRLDKTVNFVGAEAEVAALDATVREMVSAAEPQLQAGLDALTALATAPIAVLSLVKHTHLLETAALLCQYVPPTTSYNRPTGSIEPGMEQAMKIRNEAEHILGRMMSLLNVPANSDFWIAFAEIATKFAEQTKDMTTEQMDLLTKYPEGENAIEPASSTLPKMYPMMIDDRRDMEGFADDESDPEQVPALKEIGTNKQTGRKSKKRATAIGKYKDQRKGKNMKDNRKKSKLVQKKSFSGRTGTSGLKYPNYEPLMSDAQLLQSSDSD